MAQDGLIRIRQADFGPRPAARALNASFRPDAPILKLSVEIDWDPRDSRGAVADVEARLVTLCPSLREHECRGQEEYHILRSTDGRGRLDGTATPIEAALALAHLYEHVMIDTVAFVTDEPVVSGATAALEGSRNRFDIFVEAPDEVAAQLAAGLATNWVSAVAVGESLNGDGWAALELARFLYRSHPDATETEQIARELAWEPCAVREVLDWLERSGLVRRIGYTMNFSGLRYYGLV
jgi:hypothetical protein